MSGRLWKTNAVNHVLSPASVVLTTSLAMMNATKSTSAEHDMSYHISVHADFQNIASYINPDAASLTALRKRHAEMLKNVLMSDALDDLLEDGPNDHNSNPFVHGIPLLLPLTIGTEYEEKAFESAARTRNLGIHLESLSTLVSSEDLSLINSVVSKLSRKTGKASIRGQNYRYDATFDSDRLGLGLRKEGSSIVVDFVSASAREKFIERGDKLHLVNGLPLLVTSLTSLDDVVSQLAILPRPLTVSFERMPDEHEKFDSTLDVAVETKEREGMEAFSGRLDAVDLTVNEATFTFVDNEVTLLRASAKGIYGECQVTETNFTSYRFKFKTELWADYYNIRLWCWEPLLEYCSFALSAELLDHRRGSRELSIEIGDQSQTPMCVNLSDAAVESLSRLGSLSLASQVSQTEFNDPDGSTVVSSQRSVTPREAANAALLFAQRQVSESAKPFVFRNKTGVSVAFLLGEGTLAGPGRRDSDLPNLGDYGGLQGLDTSGTRVVANGEQAFFRVNVLSDERHGERCRRFPPLTASCQTIDGKVIDALRGLDVSHECKALTYPLSFASSGSHMACPRNWLSWSVIHSDERTVLSLTSSFCIVSKLTKPVEIKVAFIDNPSNSLSNIEAKLVGICTVGSSVYLPVWLAAQRRPWQCFAKFPEHILTALFAVDEEGEVQVNGGGSFYVECRSNRQLQSTFLALSTEDVDHSFTLTIDCAVALRNSLPSDCAWEINGSSLPLAASECDTVLPSGIRTEIFSFGFKGMQLRVRIPSISSWSSWVSLSLSDIGSDPKKIKLIGSPREEVRETTIVDAFGVPLSLGVRLVEKESGGVDVTIYAELWMCNCTSIPLVFGCTSHRILSHEARDPQTSFTEFSAAEAALKEISSLFDLREDIQRPISDENTPMHGRTDIKILPGQASSLIVEECFEYIEVEASTVKRRWWTTENPRAPDTNLTNVESDGTWRWLDESWVSLQRLMSDIRLSFRNSLPRVSFFYSDNSVSTMHVALLPDGKVARNWTAFRVQGTSIQSSGIAEGDGTALALELLQRNSLERFKDSTSPLTIG